MSPLLRLLGYQRPYWLMTAGAYACVLLNALMTLAVPALIGVAVDQGIARRDLDLMASLSLAIVGLSALRGLAAFGQGYLAESAAQGVGYSLRKDLYAHLQRLSFSFHDQAQTGELMARATADVEAVRMFSGRGLVHAVQLVVLLVGVSLALLRMDWLLALLSAAVLPVLAWQSYRFGLRIRPMFQAVQGELAALATFVQENVAGVRVVRTFGREADQVRRFDAHNHRLFERSLQATREQATNGPRLDLLANASTLLMLWVGGVLVMSGRLTLGELVAFYTYLLQLVGPLRRGGMLLSMAARASASAERIFEVLDTPASVADRPGAIELPPLAGRVEFQDVSCAYRPGRPVLEHVSFRVEPGQVVALVGATGSGKTSIANLIPRFYDVTSGRVLVDGYDVRDVRLQSLRRQIGVVMQETLLFSGTIRENIVFGRPTATDDEVRAVARAARADEFIERLPHQYDTRLGERGVSLSGGQKQRLAIARALLMDPRILILDEFTSSVDLETERLIREALAELLRGRTTFVIAHRLATLQRADQILVMDRGRLVARGTHAELLRACPEYRALYAAQLADAEFRVPGSESRAGSGTRHSEPGTQNEDAEVRVPSSALRPGLGTPNPEPRTRNSEPSP